MDTETMNDQSEEEEKKEGQEIAPGENYQMTMQLQHRKQAVMTERD